MRAVREADEAIARGTGQTEVAVREADGGAATQLTLIQKKLLEAEFNHKLQLKDGQEATFVEAIKSQWTDRSLGKAMDKN